MRDFSGDVSLENRDRLVLCVGDDEVGGSTFAHICYVSVAKPSGGILISGCQVVSGRNGWRVTRRVFIGRTATTALHCKAKNFAIMS